MHYYRWHKKKIPPMAIGKIICLARTYKKHADEMTVHLPKTPIIFLKPTSSIIYSEQSIVYPPKTTSLHHEIELGVIVGKEGNHIPIEIAEEYIEGYCVALDITARDIQAEAKKKGLPWTIAKGFDTFAPISDAIEKNKIPDPQKLPLLLKVNNEIRQQEITSNMIWTIPELISYISEIMTLEKGDLILTGTPHGVSEIKKGDIIEASLGSYCSLKVTVV